MYIKNKGIIFLHMHKSGGTSIETMLSSLYVPNNKILCQQRLNSFHARGFKHYSLNDIYNRILDDKDLSKYTIIIIFRNTFNRLKSVYNWMQIYHPNAPKVKWGPWMTDLKTLTDTGTIKPTVDPGWLMRMEDFINIPGVLDVSDLNLTIENRILVLKNDKVKIHMLRLEYLNKDWNNFKHIIGLPRQLIAHKNHHSHSKNSYINEYNDEQKETIKKRYHFEMNILNSEEYKSIC